MTECNYADCFRETVKEFPDRLALHYESSRYTYTELDLITDRLAVYIRSQGIGPGSVVPILVPRCEYMVIAALGVLKTGAAYEPLDISHPKRRILDMIGEVDASFVITSKKYEHLLDEGLEDPGRKQACRRICMEDIPSLPYKKFHDRPQLKDDDPFVILFTSGSTGIPKGIILTQGNIMSFANWSIPYYQMDENSRFGEYVSFVFDVSMEGLLVPLLAGASVHIIPDSIRSDFLALKEYFDDNLITHSSITTQMGRQFAMFMGDKTRTLKHLTVAGEALRAISPPHNFNLYNGYGPTECFYVTIFPVRQTYTGNVPIGYPLSEVEIYILDENGQLLPDGEVGELCIAGPHVARGYLNRPDLTRQVFTPNPYSTDPGYQRLYHTGDLARYVTAKSDRILEYLGRKDRQLKIRGYRIEPGEIEACLLGYEGIRDTVVLSQEIGNQTILAAYYLSDEPVDEEFLKERILEEKPSYMLPSFFVHMREFPLNTNGKVDITRLPAPGSADESDTDKDIKTEGKRKLVTDTEKQLAGLVSNILCQDNIGREDNFYQLGGSSITAAALLYRIYEEMHVKISVKDILKFPLIWQLAGRIDALNGTKEAAEMIDMVPVHDDRGEYQVSFAQERIYTAQNMLDREDSTYLLYLSICTEDRFEKEKVKSVLRTLFERHESFRTSFHITDHRGLVQKIEDADEAWIREAVDHSEKDIFSSCFSLDQAPLFAWIYEEKNLSFCWHHIISDGTSGLLFAREFMQLYDGGTLSPLRLHQKDYASFERRIAALPSRKKLKKGWQDVYADFTDYTGLSLPADGSFTSERRAGHIQLLLSGQLSEEIDRFCEKNNVTSYMFLLSAFSILLSRYARQEPISSVLAKRHGYESEHPDGFVRNNAGITEGKMILGTVMSERDQPGTQDLLGMFACTIPLFLKTDENQSLSDYLKRVSDTVLSAMEMQTVPLEEIAAGYEEAGGFQRTAHGHLLFDVLYVMQSMDHKLAGQEGAHTFLEYPLSDRAMYDLTLETERREEGYHCDFEYDTSLFSDESIRILARHYETLIESCLKSHSEDRLPVSGLSMVDQDEMKLLLHDFQPDHDLGPTSELKTVVELLKESVEENPEKKAVVYEDQSLTYRELWDRSSVLAGQILKELSVSEPEEKGRKERQIAIIAERGLPMIVSIWAVLRAGCAYVPISPSYPGERIQFLLHDCRPSLLITSAAKGEDLLQELGRELHIPTLSYAVNDREMTGRERIQSGSPVPDDIQSGSIPADELPQVVGDDPAYLIYTSGTTGRPKAVVIEHRQLSSLLLAYKDIYQLNVQDTVLQFADYVFDQSVWEIFHILVTGGTLCMIPEELVKNPRALADYCLSNNVTVTMMTPAFLRLLDPEAFPTLRLLDVGGEAPDCDLLLAWSKGRTVLNTYGPTETCVNAVSFLFSDKGVLRSAAKLPDGKVPIGRTIPGSRTYVLQGETLCGIGVPGELCIAGAQVARGYYGREELTREKFTEDPFFSGPMYRSGDLARVLADGNIEFMGRIDDQVKLRGFRIELKEIESVLRRLPGIEDALVLIRKTEGGEDTLCGYYTTEEPMPVSADDLRDRLEQILPHYMVPGFLIRLDQLPLTINGKVDVGALPKPERLPDKAFQEAESREETDLSEAFLKVLKLSRISVNDDFLAVGGDSIKAIRISSILYDKGYQITGSDLIRYRTIKRLASLLQASEKRQDTTEYTEYPRAVRTPVMRQFEAVNMYNPDWYNQSVLLLLSADPGQAEVERALNSLIRIHGMLRLVIPDIQLESPGLPDVHSESSVPADGEEDLHIRDAEAMPWFTLPVYKGLGHKEREEVCARLQKEMSLREGVVMKAALFINEGTETVPAKTRLFLAFHHYVIDEVSWGIILGDLDDALSGSHLLTRKGTVSFGEWSKGLWAYSDNEAFLPEKAYWESVHKNLTRQDAVRMDWLAKYRGRTEDPLKRAYADICLTLPAKVKEGLFKVAGSFHTKPDTIMLAGLALAIKEHDGAEVLTVQLESHGRGNVPAKGANDGRQGTPDSRSQYLTDRTVGWFTALYPLILDLASSEIEQIILTKEARLSVPNLGIGYGLLYEDLNEYGGIVFNYLGDGQGETFKNIRLLHEPGGADIDPANGEPDTISLDIRGNASGLLIQCRYDTVFDPERISRMLNMFVKKLTLLAGLGAGKPVYTPSDLCIGRQAMSLSDWSRLLLLYDPESLSAVSRPTSLQEGMLYRYIAEPDSRAYYLQDQLLIYGEWKETEFRQALYLCSQRFDALRLRFLYKDMEEVWQLILKDAAPEYIDASDLKFDEVLARDTERGFSIETDSLIRFTRYQEPVRSGPAKRDGQYTCILVSAHHAILDGWSFPILMDTLMDYYRKLCRGMDADKLVPDVRKEAAQTSSFEDYLKDCSHVNIHAGLRQWETYLNGLEDGVSLSLPCSGKKEKGSEKAVERSSGKKLSRRIRQYLLKNHITGGCFFGVLWALLLGAENGMSDIVFGETVSGRNRNLNGIDGIVGMLISTIPVRVQWSQDTRADDLMKRRQEDYSSMQPYEGLSLSSIGSVTGLKGRLIQTLYVYENYPQPDEDDDFRLLPLHEEVDYGLSFCVEEGEDYQLSLSFDSGLYPGEYMELLLERLLHLAAQIIEKPGIKVSELERIPEGEKTFMTGQIAGIRKQFPADTFPDLMYQQVMADPGRIALSADGKCMTYGELWASASVLAARIGFGGERYIAIITDRSFELIAAMLAVMLSGAAYVPVDKDFPMERMKTMLTDCNPASVICPDRILCPDGEKREDLMGLFSELGLSVISDIPCIREEFPDAAAGRQYEPPCSELFKDRIAYMIYTSGTTGRPKGVEMDHRALSDLIHSNEASYGSYDKDVVVLLYNPVFDASVSQIFPTLAQGGCLSIIPQERLESPEQIVDYCVENQITVMDSTNALLRTFSPCLEGRLKLRLLLAGGDETDSAACKEYARHTRMLVNDYGPTETCVHAVYYIYHKEAEARVPIGRPYPNKRIYIMQGDQLCGIGQKGEICIGGEGLARGYHGRPDLTKAAFVDNPFDGGRMYRTGDLGAFGLDHNLYFMGRKDSQVKIRGFRIETEEIAVSLKEYPGIRDAVVVPVKEEGKAPFLAAYITLEGSPLSQDGLDSIRVYLKDRLPHYMVPAFIMEMQAFPLTASGKVDRKRLPRPVIQASGTYVPPKHYYEEQVAALFERILKVDRAGRYDSFFELGGSSIDLMRLLSGLSGYKVRAADVFSRPTVRGLGKLLRKSFLKEQEEENCILLQEGDADLPAIYCLPPSGGMSMCYLPLLRELHYPGYIWGLTDAKYRSFGQMSLSDLESFDPFSEDLRQAVLDAYIEALSGSFKAGDILIGYSQGGSVAHALAGQLERDGRAPGRLIMLESAPFSEAEAAAYAAESQEESLKAVETIFFGHSELQVRKASVKDALIACLAAHDEIYSKDNEGLLHALFETYLVYRINSCMPYVTEGIIETEIHSIFLVDKEVTDSPWDSYTNRKGKIYGIAGDMDDHLVFLSKYRKQIAECIKEILESF
ncbi:MAG: amino acid adenylation domain-containing protein [Eubacterium sp.]|nr:amino acid adenylation domain-containing protein [Eubacterium sp.]